MEEEEEDDDDEYAGTDEGGAPDARVLRVGRLVDDARGDGVARQEHGAQLDFGDPSTRGLEERKASGAGPTLRFASCIDCSTQLRTCALARAARSRAEPTRVLTAATNASASSAWATTLSAGVVTTEAVLATGSGSGGGGGGSGGKSNGAAAAVVITIGSPSCSAL